MNDELLGLVPLISPDDLAVLDEGESAAFHAILSGPYDGPMALQTSVTPTQVTTVMDKLGILPIWGREGLIVYRLRLGDKIAVAGIAPDPETTSIPIEVLSRTWVECTTLDGMVDHILGLVKLNPGMRVLPEDHPEMNAIGFISPEINHVWYISTAAVEACLTTPTRYAALHQLIQSNEGRVELGLRVAAQQLMSVDDYLAAYQEMAGRTPNAPAAISQKDKEITIQLMTGKIADRYKARYLTPKKGA